jgi:hypothetical protein
VRVQVVRWDRSGTAQLVNIHFFWKREWESWIRYRVFFFFLVHKRIIQQLKRVEFVSDRMSCIMLQGCWCNIIVLNVHAPTEDKIDDMKDSFYERLECVFHEFPKYHMKILLGCFIHWK